MKRIGILLGSTEVDALLAETVAELSADEHVELVLLLSPQPAESRGLLKTLDAAFFRLVALLERSLLSAFAVPVADHSQTDLSDTGHEIVVLQPVIASSGASVRYNDADIQTLRGLRLDLIVRANVTGTLKGEIFNVAKDGIVALEHADNLCNCRGPAAFWEVYQRRPSTGFVIRQLTESTNDSPVLRQGKFRTHRSYTENLRFLRTESNPFLAQLVSAYAASGRLPEPDALPPEAAPEYQVPNVFQSLVYMARTFGLLASYIVNRKLRGRRERWGVAFVAGSWRDAKLSEGTTISNPPNRYFGDPFVVERNSRTICFLEDFEYGIERGCVTAVELFADGNYEILGPVIKEPFHMSFPFLFAYENDLYMIPETAAAGGVRLYKCRDFPMRWEYQHDLLTDIAAVDTVMFEHDERWWLLTNVGSQANGEYCSQLFAFHSNSPLAQQWTPHEHNPVLVNSLIGRNGGLLLDDQDGVVRGRQRQGFNVYGAGLSLARITELSPGTYAEEQIRTIEPDFFPGLVGCHHLHSDGKFTVYDFQRVAGTG